MDLVIKENQCEMDLMPPIDKILGNIAPDKSKAVYDQTWK